MASVAASVVSGNLAANALSGVFNRIKNQPNVNRFIAHMKAQKKLVKQVSWMWPVKVKGEIEKEMSELCTRLKEYCATCGLGMDEKNFKDLRADWTTFEEKVSKIEDAETDDIVKEYRKDKLEAFAKAMKECKKSKKTDITDGPFIQAINTWITTNSREGFFAEFALIQQTYAIPKSARSALALSELLLMNIRGLSDNKVHVMQRLETVVEILESATETVTGRLTVLFKLYFCYKHNIGKDKSKADTSWAKKHFEKTLKSCKDKLEKEASQAIFDFWNGLQEGKVVKSNVQLLAIAKKLVKVGSDHKHASSCRDVFLLLGVSYIILEDKPSSVKWLQHAARLNSGTAHLILSYLYLEDGSVIKVETNNIATTLGQLHFLIGNELYDESDPIAHFYLGMKCKRNNEVLEEGVYMSKAVQWGYLPAGKYLKAWKEKGKKLCIALQALLESEKMKDIENINSC